MNKTIFTIGLCTIGAAGLVFGFGDLLIPQEGVLFEAEKQPYEFAQLVTSQPYEIWALRGFVGVIMELIGIVCLYEILRSTVQRKTAFYGFIITLLHHLSGFGVFAIAYFFFPLLGREILQGNTSIAAAAQMNGALGKLMIFSLLATTVGNGVMAYAIWKSGVLPKWSGVAVFVGFLLLPLPGVALQFGANLLWAAGYFGMAVAFRKNNAHYTSL